jgi:hypothetical protein
MKIEHTPHFSRVARPMVLTALCVAMSLYLLTAMVSAVLAAGATTTVHLIRYGDDGVTVLTEEMVDYEWMMENLPVYGDGVTHYYHQGPVFEGDMWDPGETINLKDKGAVQGTSVRDLCDLVGGMNPEGELVIRSVDGYEIKQAYDNVYEPLDIQGPVVLCWYKSEDVGSSEDHGFGYPGNDAYSSALQIVFMAKTKNAEGKYVFGNSDMRISLPEEKYQHFYEGLPSTNGLSGKWISELRIYPAGAPSNSGENAVPSADSDRIPWILIVLGAIGLLLVLMGIYMLVWKRR